VDARALFAMSCADRRAVRVEEVRLEGRNPQRLLAHPCCQNPAHCPLKPAARTVGISGGPAACALI
jgi:hypothetical protein